jgi:methionyl-tRNA formyltransferase
MAVDETLDTGAVYARTELAIGDDEHADELRARLVDAGTDLLVEVLGRGLGEPVPQSGPPTYAEKVTPDELRLDWSLPAEQLHRVVRVGRAWTTFRGRRLLVLRARRGDGHLGAGEIVGTEVGTGDGTLELVQVQPEGKQAQAGSDWARGARLEPGEHVGT